MTKQPPILFTERPVVIFELPLAANTRLLNPDQVMLKIGKHVHDVGAFCYTIRSDKKRKANGSRHVVLSSFRKERIVQIRQVIKVFSSLLEDAGMRTSSVSNLLNFFKLFMDWADVNGCVDCLAGGDATQRAYGLFVQDVEDRFRRHEYESSNASRLQHKVLSLLEAFTGCSDLGNGIRFVKDRSGQKGGTEPASQHDFAHALALNDSLFQGLCDLILENRPFPFLLAMPKSLGWQDDFLWVFPTNRWFLPPHQWGEARAQLNAPSWAYNYEKGRLSTLDEIWRHYKGIDKQKLANARRCITDAALSFDVANSDSRNHHRRSLAMLAHNAFYFLFLANTGGNAAPVSDIETDGTLEEATANPGYRTIKWRAQKKVVSVIVPVAFVPSLRRYMELRKYLLDGKAFPYLFMSLGMGNKDFPSQIHDQLLQSQYLTLRRIDPELRAMSARKIRATVSDYYRRKHDSIIEAAVLQHKETTAETSYNAGTADDHHFEISLVLGKIAQKAKQEIVAKNSNIEARQLEEGGVCPSYGQPEPLDESVSVKPNCKSGCIFCSKRVLVAGEEDARKIASAAYLMEQLINGPQSEAEFRPQIVKCDEDLEKIRAFDGCANIVDRVKKDVFENGNLTPYFADKFQLFLSLGVLG
ncbi:hypothetical protein [Rhodoferax sp. TS-BS-61-7]|uniref:hypothetical protein n=1 Tax=Rhodoferax sp. TS-BS-61-7 TaxID=2094194 RepID=UPI000CF702DD|nr:hypothetical protein [Rhodoferax sp. TS-BS-61-7]PQA77530.1 hypothetical protein C5F53_09835 [Rhodoferax sp. TS-BS-61-7]